MPYFVSVVARLHLVVLRLKWVNLATVKVHVPWDVTSLFQRTEDSYRFHLPKQENWVRWSYQEHYRNLIELSALLTTSWSVCGRKLCWYEMCVRALWMPHETLLIKILKYHWSERESNQLHSRKFSVEFYCSWEILSD